MIITDKAYNHLLIFKDSNIMLDVVSSGCAGYKYIIKTIEDVSGLSIIYYKDISIYFNIIYVYTIYNVKIDIDDFVIGTSLLTFQNTALSWCGCNLSFT